MFYTLPRVKMSLKVESLVQHMDGEGVVSISCQAVGRRHPSILVRPSGMSRTILKIGSERGGEDTFMHWDDSQRKVHTEAAISYIQQLLTPKRRSVNVHPYSVQWTLYQEGASWFDWGLWIEGRVGLGGRRRLRAIWFGWIWVALAIQRCPESA